MTKFRRLINRRHILIGQILRFCVSTGFSASMSFAAPIALHEGLGISEKVAVAIGFVIAYLGNILLLRVFVFKSANDWKHDFFGYIVTNGAFRLIEYGAFIYLIAHSSLNYMITLLIVLSLSSFIKFFAYRRLFGNR